MAHSLELRVPFVDREIARFARSCPAHFKLDPRQTPASKRVLFEAIGHLVPVDIAWRRKRGFTLTYEDWLAGPLREVVASASSSLTQLGLDTTGLVERHPIPHQWAIATLGAWNAGRRW
jgi:asparagine synthase (glutamine-hydrolysing)